ncbi:MAG: response regulator transcription factor [Chloroflexi bacterium]|nr:response regulator transcription factor [Chloroflexota bacterium]
MLRVLIVSPLPAVRAGLRALLSGADDVKIVGEVERLEALGHRPGDAWPDVVVLDAEPAFDPVALTHAETVLPPPAVVLLGPIERAAALRGTLSGRGWSYLPRNVGADTLQAAVWAAARGLIALDPAVASGLLRGDSDTRTASVEAGETQELTAREREVLQLVATGLANKMIAARLGISEHTVKFHMAAILMKLNVGSRTEAVHVGARRGLVTL